MLPLLTNVLSPAEYGRLAIALTVSVLATFLLGLGLDIALLRRVVQFEGSRAELRRYINSVWLLLMILPLVIVVPLGCVALLVGGSWQFLTGWDALLSLLGAATYVAAFAAPLAVFRAGERVKSFVGLNIVAGTTGGVVGILLVVVLGLGPSGWLLSAITANLVVLAVAVRTVPFEIPRPFASEAVIDSLRFSLPLVPHNAVMWALQSADRLLVAAVLTVEAAGRFSLASNLAIPMLLVASSLGQAFMPAYARAGATPDSRQREVLRQTIGSQIGIAVVATLACALFGSFGVTWLAGDEYASSAELVPWIVLGYGVWALNAIPTYGVLFGVGESKGIVLTGLAGAAVNVGLVFAVAPSAGLEGVAVAAALGYASLLGASVALAAARGVRLPVPWRLGVTVIAVAGVSYALATALAGYETALDFAVRSMFFAAGASLVWLLTWGPIGKRMGPARVRGESPDEFRAALASPPEFGSSNRR